MATKPKATTAATKPAAKPAKPVVAVVATTTVSPADRIAQLVADRDHLAELRDLTEAAPRSLAEAQADIPRVMKLLASRCEPQTSWLGQSASGYADLARQLSQQDTEYGPIAAASLMAWAMPDLLTAALRRDLAASYDSMPKPMTSAAKATGLNQLGLAIRAVEAEIALQWWAAMDSGLTLDVPPVDGATLIGLAPE